MRDSSPISRLGDPRGEDEALFWIGTFHQVVSDDSDRALPFHERSYELALQSGDKLTQSYALRHLCFAEQHAGRPDKARLLLEKSTLLRREIGFLPGVAANLIGLCHIASAEGRHDDALALIAEATTLVEASGAHGIARWVDEARAKI